MNPCCDVRWVWFGSLSHDLIGEEEMCTDRICHLSQVFVNQSFPRVLLASHMIVCVDRLG